MLSGTAGAELKKFFLTIAQYPFQESAALNVSNVNYDMLKAMKAMNMLEELEQRLPVNQ